GDAGALPLGDGEFDGVISTFGAMFVPDQQRTASELARICRSGGRLAIAAWLPESNAVKFRQRLQPHALRPPVAPPSPFGGGSAGWLNGSTGPPLQSGVRRGRRPVPLLILRCCLGCLHRGFWTGARGCGGSR